MHIDELRGRLKRVRKNGDQTSAECPSHEDQHNSLSVGTGDDGKILLKCHAGCTTEDIVSALGITLGDLFPANNEKRKKEKRAASRKQDEHSNTPGLTLAEFAASKRLPVDFLRRVGVSDYKYRRSNAVRFEYRDSNGDLCAVRFRLGMIDDRFRWRQGDKVCPHGLWKLREARKKGYVILCEGESDTLTLWHHNEPALGIPGADTWQEKWAEYLAAIQTIYVVIEPDKGGETVKRRLACSRIRDRVRLLDLGESKDPSEFYLVNPGTFQERWCVALETAIPFDEVEQSARDQEAEAAYTLAKDLLHAPNLLDRIGQVMRQRGYAGDLNPPQLAYITMTSRLLERPMNAAFVSASASGKSRTVDAATELMPSEAYYEEKAGSARALIYCDEEFTHRMVIVAEADSIPEDGPAASAIRSIAADNSMEYDVVEKNPKTNRHETRRIVKAGPTGLITTSIRSLKTQMDTRVLEIPVSDDADQTRAIMHAHPRSVQFHQTEDIDLAPYIALQRWLALGGVHHVPVPFADALANNAPSNDVRMRRDFRQLLTCIQAVALLYQCQRSKTPEDWIVATIEDYARARTLLAPIFDTLASEGVTPAVRETVKAVKSSEEISEAELARRLKLAKSSVSYRVKRAIAGGWLVNNETRRGHAAKLVLGTPLPEEVSALPEPAKVLEAFERTNRSNGIEPEFERSDKDESSEKTASYTEAFERSHQNGDTPPTATDEYYDREERLGMQEG